MKAGRGRQRGGRDGGAGTGRDAAGLVGVVVAAQQAQQPPQFVEGAAAGFLDRAQRPQRLGGTGRADPPADAGLHGDDAQAVRKHVVQFPGDPQPLRLERVSVPARLRPAAAAVRARPVPPGTCVAPAPRRPSNHIAAAASMLCTKTFWVCAVAAAVSSPAPIAVSAATRQASATILGSRSAAMYAAMPSIRSQA